MLHLLQGYLVNWDIQKTVWDYVFGKDVFNVNHSNTTMIVTEPYLNFTSTQEALSEIFFEEYEVDALLRINGEDEKLWCFLLRLLFSSDTVSHLIFIYKQFCTSYCLPNFTCTSTLKVVHIVSAFCFP